jgi:hypothetical protein
VPGVARAEAWRRAGVSVSDAVSAGSEPAARLALVGIPPGSQLQRRPVVEGRSLRDGATDEVLATRHLLAAHPQMRLGALVHLTYRERQHPVRVVGLVEEIGQTTLLAPEATFEAVTGLGDAGSSLRVEARDGVSLQAGLKRKGPAGNSITTVEPSRKRPISAPCASADRFVVAHSRSVPGRGGFTTPCHTVAMLPTMVAPTSTSTKGPAACLRTRTPPARCARTAPARRAPWPG